MNTAASPWSRWATTPHRALFSAGTVAACALALWWSGALVWPGSGTIPPMLVHGLLMPLGVFPLFMWGFLFTAGPRWLNVTGPTQVAPLAISYLIGLLLCGWGWSSMSHAATGRWIALGGLGLMVLCWSWVIVQWARCLQRSRTADRRHARIVLGALIMGWGGVLAAVWWTMHADQAQWWLLSRQVLQWGLLLPVFLTVSHRMVPFFTQSALPGRSAWRPYALLWGWLAGCGLLLLSSLLSAPRLHAGVATLMAASLLYTSWRWGVLDTLSHRLLAMLHLSFAWFGIGMTLQALTAWGWALGSAATHALSLGACFTMLMGFVTRVTLGHSGRPLVADRVYWCIYLSLHMVALTRVLMAIMPPGMPVLASLALVWSVVLLIWSARVLPIYLQARVDGQPG